MGFNEKKQVITVVRKAVVVAEKRAKNGCFKCIRVPLHTKEQESFAKKYLVKNYPAEKGKIRFVLLDHEEREHTALGTIFGTA